MDPYIRVDKQAGCGCWQLRYHNHNTPDPMIRRMLDFVTCIESRTMYITMGTLHPFRNQGFFELSDNVRKERI